MRLAVQQVRSEILLMARDADWSRVVLTLRRELRTLVRYNGCGINLLHADGHVVSFSSGHGLSDTLHDPELPRPLALALQTGRPVYRRNREEMVGNNYPLMSDILRVMRQQGVDQATAIRSFGVEL